ncbi:hypothetical protein OPV22_006146 [Ensete ventricosum]|uniref:Uncharacterized protein n=1 Tax=Ensete ventricosum TaxID=4639 RepID=A0AAV8RST2_ENSVE|nr:hypothetical protein OPV22_006146 [Ensete ventricosum]
MAGGFEEQVKERAKELKHLVKKGMKAVGETCKKTWHKNKRIHTDLVMLSYACQVNDILSSRKETVSDLDNLGLLRGSAII